MHRITPQLRTGVLRFFFLHFFFPEMRPPLIGENPKTCAEQPNTTTEELNPLTCAEQPNTTTTALTEHLNHARNDLAQK